MEARLGSSGGRAMVQQPSPRRVDRARWWYVAAFTATALAIAWTTGSPLFGTVIRVVTRGAMVQWIDRSAAILSAVGGTALAITAILAIAAYWRNTEWVDHEFSAIETDFPDGSRTAGHAQVRVPAERGAGAVPAGGLRPVLMAEGER